MAQVTYSIPAQPRQVRLELSSFCKAHCKPCHRWEAPREDGHMPFTLVEKIVEDIKGFPQPLAELVPTNFGETLCHPEAWRILDFISRRLPRTPMVLPMNAVMLTDGVVDKLAQIPSLRLVNISINAFLKETFEAYHHVSGECLERLPEKVAKLRQLRPDLILWLSLVELPGYQSPKEVELFREFWSKYGHVMINRAEFNNRPEYGPIIPVRLACRSLFSDLAIGNDGMVVSCCYLAFPDPELVVGDAKKEELLNIWHSGRFSEIRQLHLQGKRAEIQRCRSCSFA